MLQQANKEEVHLHQLNTDPVFIPPIVTMPFPCWVSLGSFALFVLLRGKGSVLVLCGTMSSSIVYPSIVHRLPQFVQHMLLQT